MPSKQQIEPTVAVIPGSPITVAADDTIPVGVWRVVTGGIEIGPHGTYFDVGSLISSDGTVTITWAGAGATISQIVTGLPVAPSPNNPAPGIQQPQFGSGSATLPMTPIPITGSPIIPPPPIADGAGGPPAFPPGVFVVPEGPKVGPAVAPAPAPPSVPGVTQPQIGPVPPPEWPGFTTNPPSPPIVFANQMMIGNMRPPTTPTHILITIGGWSPFSEPDSDVKPVHGGDAGPLERRGGSVLQHTDADEVDQPEPEEDSRSKRVPKGRPSRRPNRS
jgi:hypothetical protein